MIFAGRSICGNAGKGKVLKMRTSERRAQATLPKTLSVSGSVAAFGLIMAVGILLGSKELLGGMMPLGAAFAAAVPSAFAPAAAAGTLLGAVAGASADTMSKYAAAALIASVTKPIMKRIIRPRADTALTSCCAVFSMLAGGVLNLILSQGASGLSLFMLFCECLLTGSFAFFFSSAEYPLKNKLKIGCLSGAELTAVTVSFAAVLASVSGLELYGVSPARMLSVAVILAAARWGGEAAGVIAGTAAGMAMTLGGGREYIYLAGAYAFGGLTAGIMSRFGRAGTAAAFIVSNGLFSLMSAGGDPAMITIYEVFAATVIFMILPKSLCERLCGFFAPRSEPLRMTGLRRSLTSKLSFAAESLNDVSSTVEKVAERLDERGKRSMDAVFDRTKRSVCRFCALKSYCLETAKEQTDRELTAAAVMIRAGKREPKEVLSRELRARCAKPDELTGVLVNELNEYAAAENAARRLREIRGAVSDQLGSVASLLSGVAQEFERVERYDDDAAAKAEEILRQEGVIPSDVGCRLDENGRMTLEITVKTVLGGVMSHGGLVRELSAALGRDFDIPVIDRANDLTVITIGERAIYRLETGISQYSCRNNPLCGDSCVSFPDGRGRDILLISDGMGSGGRAAVDGAMVTGLMTRLIKAGFGFDCALTVVNSAMLFKSEDESLATVDAASFDLFSGKCSFHKAGCPAAVVRKDGRVGRAECSSFPAGILREVSFDTSECTFSEGDIIVMVSDGLTFDGDGWIGEELLRFKRGTAQQLADHLIAVGRERRSDGREDDMTVMAAIVRKAL